MIQLLVYLGMQVPVDIPVVPRIGEEVIPPTGGPAQKVTNVRYNLTGADAKASPAEMNYGIYIYLREKE